MTLSSASRQLPGRRSTDGDNNSQPCASAAPQAARLDAADWLLVLAVLAGGALRFAGLSRQSLWLDEILSQQLVSTSSVAETLRNVAHDVHPPLYFVILHYWVGLFGTSALALRLPSAIVGTAGTYFIYRAALRVLSTRSGAVAVSWLYATNLLLIYYAQEARAYAWLGALAPLSMAFLLDYVAGLRLRILASWVITTTCLLYVHYFSLSSSEVAFLRAAMRDLAVKTNDTPEVLHCVDV
jgi:predicted membrane-bound mannosyltransferase